MRDGEESRAGDGAGPVVLVVEDDPGMGEYLGACLGPLKARVVVVADGVEALERLRAGGEAFDLVITDVRMPRLGGESLILEIERDPALRGLPVLVITGITDDVECAGRPVLHKPFGAALLRTYVSEILGQREEGEQR